MLSRPDVTLVIPCFNEAQRLPVTEFINYSQFNYVFVNDGSSDLTEELLVKNFSSLNNCRVLSLFKNRGKAEAVRQGMLRALEEFPQAEWIGFWDADLSTPLSEVAYFLDFYSINMSREVIDAIWGSRIYRLGADVKRSLLRHYLGRIFVTFVSNYLKLEAYDTQCGAKLFRQSQVREIFSEPFISPWIFDIEILLRMKQRGILECPVRNWVDIKGSKVRVLRDLPLVFRDLWRIKAIQKKTGF